MATIKAGTYTLKETLDFSMLTYDGIIQYAGANITIGDVVFDGAVYFSIYINKDGTITHNDVSWVESGSPTQYTFYENSGWTDEKYRTWVFAGDYENVDDDVADWFNANLYVPEAKFVRLIREDEVEQKFTIRAGIDGGDYATFSFKEGATWEDFVKEEATYFSIDGEYVKYVRKSAGTGYDGYVRRTSTTQVLATDTIRAGFSYFCDFIAGGAYD